jgi:hypothetical protein
LVQAVVVAVHHTGNAQDQVGLPSINAIDLQTRTRTTKTTTASRRMMTIGQVTAVPARACPGDRHASLPVKTMTTGLDMIESSTTTSLERRTMVKEARLNL